MVIMSDDGDDYGDDCVKLIPYGKALILAHL